MAFMEGVRDSVPPGDPARPEGTILVADDEPYMVGMLSEMLEGRYDVVAATDGQTALDRLQTSAGIDVVLLDRRMPGIGGDEVLARMRSRNDDRPVVMITAVDPDLDIADMRFDAYLVKPVRRAEVLEVVETVRGRSEYDRTVRSLYSISARISALEQNFSHNSLEATPEYRELCRRRAELAESARETLDWLMERDEPSLVYRDVLSEFK